MATIFQVLLSKINFQGGVVDGPKILSILVLIEMRNWIKTGLGHQFRLFFILCTVHMGPDTLQVWLGQ